MNKSLINNLIKHNRSGKIIKLIESNIHNWSVKDFEYIFVKCINQNKVVSFIFIYMLEHFANKKSINLNTIQEEDLYHGEIYSNCDYSIMTHLINYDNYLWIMEVAFEFYHYEKFKYLLSNEIQYAYPYINISDHESFYIGDFVLKTKRTIDYCCSKNIINRFEIENFNILNREFLTLCRNNGELAKYFMRSDVQEIWPINSNHYSIHNIKFVKYQLLINACEYKNNELVKYMLSPEIHKRYEFEPFSHRSKYGIKHNLLSYAAYVKNNEIIDYLLSPNVLKRYPRLRKDLIKALANVQ